MAGILQIETSSTLCSVSLSSNGRLIHEEVGAAANDHMMQLTLLIRQLFTTTNISGNDLDAVAISAGPGSYTGLRIGVSTAKGLCHALQKPLIAVPSLLSMVQGAVLQRSEPGLLYCPLTDARRMEVYTLVADATGAQLAPSQALVVESLPFVDILESHKILFFGSGYSKCRHLIVHPNALALEDFMPLSSYMTAITHDLFESGRFEDVAYFEPYYLKDVYTGKK